MSGPGKLLMTPHPKWQVIFHRSFPMTGFELLITCDKEHSDDLHIGMHTFDLHLCTTRELSAPISSKEEADAIFKELISEAEGLAYKFACQSAAAAKMEGRYVIN